MRIALQALLNRKSQASGRPIISHMPTRPGDHGCDRPVCREGAGQPRLLPQRALRRRLAFEHRDNGAAAKIITAASTRTTKPMLSVSSQALCTPDCAQLSKTPNCSIINRFGGRGGFEPTVPLRMPVFKTGALNHSATLPAQEFQSLSVAPARTQCERGPNLDPNTISSVDCLRPALSESGNLPQARRSREKEVSMTKLLTAPENSQVGVYPFPRSS